PRARAARRVRARGTVMATGSEQDEKAPTRRLGERSFVPLVMLVALLVVLAHLYLKILAPFTGPQSICDAEGGYLFYDEGDASRGERSFYWHRIEDGKTSTRPLRVDGILLSAALRSDKLVLLFGASRDEHLFPDFYSVYDRKSAEREWSGGIEKLEI